MVIYFPNKQGLIAYICWGISAEAVTSTIASVGLITRNVLLLIIGILAEFAYSVLSFSFLFAYLLSFNAREEYLVQIWGLITNWVNQRHLAKPNRGLIMIIFQPIQANGALCRGFAGCWRVVKWRGILASRIYKVHSGEWTYFQLIYN